MSRIQDKISGYSLYTLAQLTRKTCRFQLSGMQYLEEAKASGRPLILATWHGMTMMLVSFFIDHYDLSNVVLIMPDDWRGAALSIFASKLGTTPYPMDLTGEQSMASARTLATLVRQVKNGQDCYITPDGPDGPAYVIKPGVAYIARKAKAVILPIGGYARHSYRLNRWDQYVVPYPFSRISIDIGAPIVVEKSKESLATITDPLTDTLHRVTAQAAANYYEQAR